jgi:hypothetical protein
MRSAERPVVRASQDVRFGAVAVKETLEVFTSGQTVRAAAFRHILTPHVLEDSMKRLARPALAFGLAVGISILSLGRAALATPFADVPANHWAYQYIQALAADGIIDGYNSGNFNGNRPMTRYEAAAMVARAVNKVSEVSASKEDLDKLAKLVDAFRDELDALGVRVTNLEDRLDYLDAKTKFAQSVSMAADIRSNVPTARQRTLPASSVSGGAIDPLTNQYLTSDDSNIPYAVAGSGINMREDAKITFIYRVTDQLTVSLPLRLMNYDFGGTYGQQNSLQIVPTLQLNLAQSGQLKNFTATVGTIDNLTSSRTGLTFRAPLGDFNPGPYEYPLQPLQKGVLISGNFAGNTDFNASFTRVDQTYFNTQGYDISQQLNNQTYSYLYPVVPPQSGFVQTSPAGSPKVDTFNSGSAPLSQAFLSSPAQIGSVYITSINGQSYNPNGSCASSPCNGPAAAYTFYYNQANNEIVFNPPVPAGTVIGVAYTAYAVSSNVVPQRYMWNARVNQKFPSVLGGMEIGVTYVRIFDFADPGFNNSDSGTTYNPGYQASLTGGQVALPLLSDTVVGADFQLKLPFELSGAGSQPTLFGELSQSKFSADIQNQAATSDTAGVVGIKANVAKVQMSLQYQSIGQNYVVGDDIQFSGNPPTVLAAWRGPNMPDFFGFANNLAINTAFDQQFASLPACGGTVTTGCNPKLNTAGNSALTLLYPAYNPFKGNGPMDFSSYNPNNAGVTFNLNAPIVIGGKDGTTFTTRAQYQYLQEINPDSIPAQLYGPAYASNVKMNYQTATVGAAFDVPAFGQKISFNLAGTYETLDRNDKTGFQYYPFNYNNESTVGATAIGPNGAVLPPTSLVGVAQANAAIPVCTGCTFPSGSQVIFYPNYVKMTHYIFALGATVPLAQNLLFNATYNSQPYGGSYGTTLGQNISEVKTYYQGNITYRIPKTNSSIQFQARNYHYTDSVVSSYNFNQNREDINFNVRF